MNIYATGMNPVDCNALKRSPRVELTQNFVEMMQYLRGQGERLSWRATKVGDNIPSEIDVVIVSMLLPRSLNSPYALGALWTISEALRRDIPLILYMADWAFYKAHGEYRSIVKAGNSYFSKEIGGSPQYRESVDMIAKHGGELMQVCRQYTMWESHLWKRAQIVVPKYTNWGDMDILQNLLPGANLIQTYDPTPLFMKNTLGYDEWPELPPVEIRGRRWMFASLLTAHPWVDKQNLHWPVDRFGPKGHTVVTEKEILPLYRERAGAIAPPYQTDGSGWWRSRWLHAALAGSVLLCGSGDQLEMGEWYRFWGYQYEDMTNSRLQFTAEGQREIMRSVTQLDMSILHEQVYDPIRKAIAS